MAWSAPSSLDSSLCCSRSAESWIGVSGFLISCARRRATSLQASLRCAETTSVMSSKTISRAPCGIAAPRTSSVSVSRSRPCGSCVCSSKESCQWSRSPASGLVACSSKRCHTRLREGLQARHLVEPPAAVGRQRQPQDARGAGVDGVDAALAVEHDHAGGQVVEDGLQVGARALDLPHAALHQRARLGELLGHVGERARQAAELVARGEHRLGAEVAVRHLVARLRPAAAAAARAGCRAAPPAARAPNTASTSASVSVPMYMRRRPSRASARCWYSR